VARSMLGSTPFAQLRRRADEAAGDGRRRTRRSPRQRSPPSACLAAVAPDANGLSTILRRTCGAAMAARVAHRPGCRGAGRARRRSRWGSGLGCAARLDGCRLRCLHRWRQRAHEPAPWARGRWRDSDRCQRPRPARARGGARDDDARRTRASPEPNAGTGIHRRACWARPCRGSHGLVCGNMSACGRLAPARDTTANE
jgi:hypothetical protein